MLRIIVAATLAASLGFSLAGAALAGDMPMVTDAAKLTWMPAPGLPPGAQFAVLSGDPSKPGPFTMRLKFPAGYFIPTHSHPTDELITVISGKARMAFGEAGGEDAAEPMPPESFMALPGGYWHTLWIDADTVVEMHSTGPFATTLLHPAQ
jgi:quercetin dioxygenase-like cupin family protein